MKRQTSKWLAELLLLERVRPSHALTLVELETLEQILGVSLPVFAQAPEWYCHELLGRKRK